MNRANPHWAALRDQQLAKLVFHGPDSYVSPTLYETDVAAPTWNFVAVHAVGSVHLVKELDETLDVVNTTARSLEAQFGADFNFTKSADYYREIVPGVGAFYFTVDYFDAMFKLSQEKSDDVRGKVASAFAHSESSARRDLANLMQAGDVAQPEQERQP